MNSYGKELILDLYDCNTSTFDRGSIKQFMIELCDLINMEREDLYFWDYEGGEEEKAKAPVHLVGTSAVQFITTSDIVIHTLDLVGECYINIFSCKEFNSKDALDFTNNWFEADKTKTKTTSITRGERTKTCQ